MHPNGSEWIRKPRKTRENLKKLAKTLKNFATISKKFAKISLKIFKRPKNGEDCSDFDDFWTKNIAATRPIFGKIFERTSSSSWHGRRRNRHRRRRRRERERERFWVASITEP